MQIASEAQKVLHEALTIAHEGHKRGAVRLPSEAGIANMILSSTIRNVMQHSDVWPMLYFEISSYPEVIICTFDGIKYPNHPGKLAAAALALSQTRREAAKKKAPPTP